ncbi:MAG: hypothetical protein KF684_01105 [Phycisphaeraceae bacterium]|nr:hypothetical protein [Phycisphaeraceae bacterium]
MPRRPALPCSLLAISLALIAGCASTTPSSAQPPAPEHAARGASGVPANHYDYFGGLRFDDATPRPVDTIGHEIGERFTRQHLMADYLTRLAAQSDRVRIEQYGQSHQRRPLHLVTISSPRNLDRLDEILAKNRELFDPRATSDTRARQIIETNPAIVWFSFNVHGNEASCSEVAMQVAYTLAAGQNKQVQDILDNVVLIIDPLLNPDGRERYLSFFDNAAGASPNPTPATAEHDEPWPSGRPNHYLFDLNRDWLWMVHPESRSRIARFVRHKPQLHIDYHEQGAESPYFFGAGDSPYNANIPAETREWLDIYGKANAAVFDERGLEYSTRERFDYLYPGYGKVLPVYHGAVGLLTEKAGHGRAGLSIMVRDRYELLLRDRVRDHFLTAMSYLETTAENRVGQLERFHRFAKEAMTLAPDEPTAYLVTTDTDPAILTRLWDLLTPHGIEIHSLERDAEVAGLIEYRDGKTLDPRAIAKGAWVVRVDQPMGRLVRVLFERETHVEDPDTYDITAWSMPIAFGLDAYAMTGRVELPMTRLEKWDARRGETTGDGRAALVVNASQHAFPLAASAAARHDLFGRVAARAFTLEDQRFSAGSLIFATSRNDSGALDAFAAEINGAGLNAHRAGAGIPSDGPALGADMNRYFVKPRALLLRGPQFSSLSFGQHWHLFDVDTPIPYDAVNADSIGSVKWDLYTALVLPESSQLGRVFEGARLDALKSWVRSGGVVVASGSSAVWASRTLLDLKLDEPERDETKLSELSWEERRLRAIDNRVSGVLLRAAVDQTHPMASGAPAWFGLIKRGANTLPIGDSGSAVARFESPALVSGLINERNAARFDGSPAITHHRLGRGSVICFADDPTFRGFNHAGARLLLNAIIFGPSM